MSFAGRELIEEANALGITLDLSHCGHRTRAEAAALANFPVCTHSNAYAVLANDRNTKDGTAHAIAAKGGMMGVCGLPRSVDAGGRPTLAQLLDHVDHFVATIGIDHVGVGFDFIQGYVDSHRSGGDYKPPKWRILRPDIFGTPEDFFNDTYPAGIHAIGLLPNFTQGLLDRGYTPDETAAILGGNWRRTYSRSLD